MIYNLNINNRAFNAIINGTKSIEIRANDLNSKTKYNEIKIGDIIIFKNNESQIISCSVIKITLYKSVRELLEIEGTEKTLSSTNCLEEGIKSIESISNYKEVIPMNGVFAIEIKLNNNMNNQITSKKENNQIITELYVLDKGWMFKSQVVKSIEQGEKYFCDNKEVKITYSKNGVGYLRNDDEKTNADKLC